MKQHKILDIITSTNKLLKEVTASYPILLAELDTMLKDPVYSAYKGDIEKALGNEDTQTLVDIIANIKNAEHTNNQ